MDDLLSNYGHTSSSEESSAHEIPEQVDVGQKRKLETNLHEKASDEPPKKKLKLPSIFDENKPNSGTQFNYGLGFPSDLGFLENDSTKHGGKVRGFAHVEGNYPSHVFIKVSLPQLVELTTEIIELSHADIDASVIIVPLEAGEWHISLSRPFPMREHHIKLFVESLQHTIETCQVQPFDAHLTEREIYVNDEKTRSFIGLNVTGPGCSQVVRLIKAVDSVMKSFAFPMFYEDPKPHVTVAWMLGDVKQQHEYPSAPLEEEQCLSFQVDVVQCRIGKFNHFFKLK